jgi:hypothetical protein
MRRRHRGRRGGQQVLAQQGLRPQRPQEQQHRRPCQQPHLGMRQVHQQERLAALLKV